MLHTNWQAGQTGAVAEHNEISKRLLNLKDFGAKGDGVTDDTAAIQAAIDSSIDTSNTGTRIIGERVVYPISSTLVIPDKLSVEICGKGIGSTAFKWIGADGDTSPMIRFANGYRNALRDLQLIPSTNPAKTVGAVVEFYRSAGYHYGGHGHTLTNVWLGTQNTTYATYGVVMRHDGATDSMNDFHTFNKVKINCGIVANVSIQHSQSKAHSFIDCFFDGGQYGVTNAVNSTGGSFHWYGGWCAGHSLSDFYLHPGSDAIVLDSINSEGSNRFLMTTGPSTNTQPVTVRGVRWANNALNADGYWILWQTAGPLVVEGCQLDGFDLPVPRIRVENSNLVPVSVSFRNNGYVMPSSDVIDPINFTISSQGPSYIERTGNVYRTSDNKSVIKSDIMRSPAEPNSGYWSRGNIIYNTMPVAGGSLGWVCVQSGIAGDTAVFKTFGSIAP